MVGGPLDEIVLFSLHKFSVIMWRHDVTSFESLETVAMHGYFVGRFTHKNHSEWEREKQVNLTHNHKL